MIDMNKLSKVFELIKQVGIYQSAKTILSNPLFKEMMKQRVDFVANQIKTTYQIEDYVFLVEQSDDGSFICTLSVVIPHSNNRKVFLEKINDAIKKLLESKSEFAMPFIIEFDIKRISAREVKNEVIVSFSCNEKLINLINDIKTNWR